MKINTIEEFFSMYDKLSIILQTSRSMQNESTLIVVELESIRFLVVEKGFSWISTGIVMM